MIIKALLAGFISFLTPVVLIPLLFITIAFGSIDKTIKDSSILKIFFGVIIFLFSLTGLYVTAYIPEMTIDFNLFIFILACIFTLWLLGLFDYFLPKLQNHFLFISLLIITSGVLFFGLILSNLELIIIALLESAQTKDFITIFSSVMFFAMGFVIPTSLISLLLLKKIRKWRDRNWWKRIQVVSGILFLVLIIMSQLFW